MRSRSLLVLCAFFLVTGLPPPRVKARFLKKGLAVSLAVLAFLLPLTAQAQTYYFTGNIPQMPGATTVNTTCDSNAIGAIRYNTGTVAFEGCDGTTWAAIGGGTPAGSTTQIQFNSGGAFGASANLVWDIANSRLGIGTTAPTNPLSFTGQSAQKIWMERETTAATAGNTLTLAAGGATSGSTDKNGGDLILTGGTATGFGSSNISLRVAEGPATGTTDRVPTELMKLTGGSFSSNIQYAVQWGAAGANSGGLSTTAWGNGTLADGSYATAFGQGAAAHGIGSTAIGYAQAGTSLNTGGSGSVAIGATVTSCVDSSTCPKVQGNGSVGVFMGNHTGAPITNLSAGSTFALMGGKFYINPGTSLGTIGGSNVRAGVDAGNVTDAIVLPTGSVAQRPTATNGMLRYNSDTDVLEFVKAGVWTTIGAAGTTVPAGANTQIQYNNGGAMGASSSLTWTAGAPGTMAVTGNVTATNNITVAKNLIVSPQSSLAAPNPLKVSTLGDTSISSPSNGQCLTYNSGTSVWTNSACSSGSLGGADTQVQFNDAGTINGSSNFTWTKGSNTLGVTGTVAVTGTVSATSKINIGGTSGMSAPSSSLALSSLSDTSISSPVSGDFLTYNGTSWVNSGSSTSGTFTPVYAGTTTPGVNTYTNQIGSYTVIGKLVFFSIRISWTASTAAGAPFMITGLPFTSKNTAGLYQNVTTQMTVLYTALGSGRIPPNTTYIELKTTPLAALADVAVDTAADITISGSYIAN